MARLDELPFTLRLFMRTYRWRRIRPTPWTPLRKPLRESRFALVTTGGLVEPGQQPFDESYRGGDASYRVIRNDSNVGDLVEYHRSKAFDHSGIAMDANLAFPLDRFHELEQSGRIGKLNHRHISFMGSLTATMRLTKETAPKATRLLLDDGVDAVLLVPV